MAIGWAKGLERGFKRMAMGVLAAVSRARPSASPAQLKPGQRVLVIRLHRLGDALVTTGLLAELHRQLGVRITVLAEDRNAFLFRELPFVEEVLVYRRKLTDFLAFRKLRFDAVVDSHDKPSSTVTWLLALVKAPVKAGFARAVEKGQAAYTHTVARPDDRDTHVMDRLRQLALPLGMDPAAGDWNVQFPVKPEQAMAAQEWLARWRTVVKPLVGVNLFAGGEERYWGDERFRRVLEWFTGRNCDVVVLCPADAEARARGIVGPDYPIWARRPFGEYAAMIAQLDLLFTPDTSAIHLCSAYGVPVFGLYVWTDSNQNIWHSYASRHAEVRWPRPDFSELGWEVVEPALLEFVCSLPVLAENR